MSNKTVSYEGYILDVDGEIYLDSKTKDEENTLPPLFDVLASYYEEGEYINIAYNIRNKKDDKLESYEIIKGIINRIDYELVEEHIGNCICDKNCGDYLYEDETCDNCDIRIEHEHTYVYFIVDGKNICAEFLKKDGKYLTLFINDRRIIIEDLLNNI
jgi:hypothetical protein